MHEVQKTFELLRSEGMIRFVAFSRNGDNGDIRYDVYDQSVKVFLEDCWELYSEVYSITELIWKKLRGSTADEIRSLELLRGTQTANEISIKMYEKRRKHFERFKNRKQFVEKYWPAILKYNNAIKKHILID